MRHPRRKHASQFTAELLEHRIALTGDGIGLPLASMNAADVLELMPGEQGQISQAVSVDLNGDGLLDYATAVSGLSRRITLFLADGEAYSRHDLSAISDNYFEAIAYGDINGDDLPDVIAATDRSVRTYLNLGFSADNVWLGMQAHEQVRVVAHSLSVADLNDDQRDDLILGTDQRVDVRIANAQGRFLSGIWYLNTKDTKVVTAGDVNRDGHMDVVVNSFESAKIDVLLNDGEGFLSESQVIENVEPTRTLALLDVNGDGYVDLLAGGSNQHDPNVHIWQGTVVGEFDVASAVDFETVGAPQTFAVGDINGDELADLLVGHGSTFHHPITNNGPGGLSVLLATGPGEFQTPIRVVTPGTSGIDLLLTDSVPTIQFIDDFGNRLTKLTWNDVQMFDSAQDFSNAAENLFRYRRSVFADFNQDGIADAVVADLYKETIDAELFLANADGTYAVTPLSLNPLQRVYELFVGDFNGDGVDDLGVQSDTMLYSLISNGDGTFQPPQAGQFGAAFVHHRVVDINQDGRDDLVGTDAIPSATWLVSALADENGRWVQSKDRQQLSSPFVSELNLLDLNADDQLDAVVSSFQATEMAMGNGDGSFGVATTIPLDVNIQAAGDIDGDGLGDIVGTSFGETKLSIAFGQADGTYRVSTNVPLDLQPKNTQGIQAVDIEGDGVAELILAGSDRFYLLQFDGSSGFTSREFVSGFGAAKFFVQDVTGDAIPDLIAAPGANFIGGTPTTHITVIPGQGDGQLGEPMNTAVSMIDGQLAAIQNHGEQVEFYIAHRVGFGKLSATIGIPVPGDFDGDGQISSADVDLLCAASHAADLPADDVAKFDQNDDGRIDAVDVDRWLAEVAQTQRGDADLDGDVDFADFLLLSGSFGRDEPLWSNGDFDCDGQVGFSDFLLLSAIFGTERA